MDIEHAKELLLILSDGINPLTGEILPDEDSCNQVEIVRALNTVIRALDAQQTNEKKPKPTTSSSHENAGKPWTEADDNALCRMFDAGYSKKDICAHFKRSPGSIAARLVRLGKIEKRIEFRTQK